MIDITEKTIDAAAVLDSVRSPGAGAVVLFLGTVRQDGDRPSTAAIEYECYAEMARKKLAELEAEALRRWPLSGCAIVHRVGRLAVGEVCVAVAVAAPHRREAFEAGEWLIDRIKEVVPIWKQEHLTDGTSRWI